MESMSFHVVKIHHGSRSSASHGRVRTLASDPKELKYAKFDHASVIQNGCTQISEMMKKRDPQSGRNGRIFNHDTTLWRKYDMKRRVAVADRYQPYAGSFTKMNVPCQMASTSFSVLV